MQSGKTTDALNRYLAFLEQVDCLPIFATHASLNVLQDLRSKMRDRGIFQNNTILNPRDNRAEWNKFVSRLMKFNTVDDNFGIVGLKNEAFFKRLDSALVHYHQEKVLFNDEYDTDQIRFIRNRQPVKRDNQIRSYEIENLITRMELLSATNLAAMISDNDYDEIRFIKPGKGYNCERNYEIVSDRAMEALRLGKRHDDIDAAIEATEHNVMVNVSTLQDDHSAIADALDGQWDCMVVNSDENELYDFTRLDNNKTVVIGGNMFNRGQTFNRIQTLIFDRPTHQAAMLQSIGRLFGYRDYKTKIICTASMKDQIEEAFGLESLITEERLRMPHKARHEWLSQQTAPKNLGVFSPKNNGWKTVNIPDYAVEKPEMTVPYDDVWFARSDVTMLQKRIDGAPPARGQDGYYGTCKWGNRTVEKYVEDFCNQHPQGRILSEPNDRGELRRKTIVPPLCEQWFDETAQEMVYEWEQVDRDIHKRHHLDTHWWVDNNYNSDKREQCMTKYVGSVLATGEIALWFNLNVLSDNRATTRFKRN